MRTFEALGIELEDLYEIINVRELIKRVDEQDKIIEFQSTALKSVADELTKAKLRIEDLAIENEKLRTDIYSEIYGITPKEESDGR